MVDRVMELEILGQKIAVKSDEDEEYIKAVESYLNNELTAEERKQFDQNLQDNPYHPCLLSCSLLRYSYHEIQSLLWRI